MTALQVVDQMQQRLTGFEPAGKIDTSLLRQDLGAYVDQSSSRKFEQGVHYFWNPGSPSGGIVMVNAELDYLTLLVGEERF